MLKRMWAILTPAIDHWRKSGDNTGTLLARVAGRREGVMMNGIAPRKLAGFLAGLGEHAFLVIAGVVLMVLGLVLIVTMIMPPAGVAIGLLGS
jgi:hypothetical protein